MAEEKTTQPAAHEADSDALAKRLEAVERMIGENDALRRSIKLYSAGGILLIILILTMLFVQLVNHARNYDVAALGDELMESAEPVITGEIRALGHDLQSGAVEDFMDKLHSEFREEWPKIEEAAGDMGARLAKHTEEHVKLQLVEALATSFEECEADIRKIFPEFTIDELEKRLNASKDLFVEELVEVIELHLARVGASIEGIKSAVTRVASSHNVQYDAALRPGEAEQAFLDAIRDLLVYEIKPELGEAMADAVNEGGAQ